ncbi:MAG: SEC-C metal-binding domain-containing protein [Phycisphaerales bacterium]
MSTRDRWPRRRGSKIVLEHTSTPNPTPVPTNPHPTSNRPNASQHLHAVTGSHHRTHSSSGPKPTPTTGGAPCTSTTTTTPTQTTPHSTTRTRTTTAFEATSKRRKGFPSETSVKRGHRAITTAHGQKELLEKLGRNDLCPCGSGQRFQDLLPQDRPLSMAPTALTTTEADPNP